MFRVIITQVKLFSVCKMSCFPNLIQCYEDCFVLYAIKSLSGGFLSHSGNPSELRETIENGGTGSAPAMLINEMNCNFLFFLVKCAVK